MLSEMRFDATELLQMAIVQGAAGYWHKGKVNMESFMAALIIRDANIWQKNYNMLFLLFVLAL